MPNRDEWTESTPQIWASNGHPTKDRDNSTTVSNYSIASSVTNRTYIWMRLTDIGPYNSSGKTSYEELAFWIKWKRQNDMLESPTSTLKLFSDRSDNHFKLDFSHKSSNSSDEWREVRVDISPTSEEWRPVGSADWNRITGLEFELSWSTSANLTVKIDDLHFAKFVPLTEGFLAIWFDWLATSAFSFFLQWGIYGGTLSLVIKVLGEKLGSWKALFIVVGYLFSVKIVHILVAIISVSMLPRARLENLSQIWPTSLPYQTIIFFSLVTDVWMAALCAIAIRNFYNFTWRKAIMVSVLATLLNFIMRPLTPIYL